PNFLIKHTLYQRQEPLHPEKWLQVEAMNIILTTMMRSEFHDIYGNEPLRDYYTKWMNYEANEGEVKRLL
ncbi:molecular chaperone DnaJ, partial [Vibrio cholerae O1]|nr:molecular chaperone DnaJ [Vibrio cholerae O1]